MVFIPLNVREDPVGDWTYKTVHSYLSAETMNQVMRMIQESPNYELGDLGHILPVGSPDAVGFIKEDGDFYRFDLANTERKHLKPHHEFLLGLISKLDM